MVIQKEFASMQNSISIKISKSIKPVTKVKSDLLPPGFNSQKQKKLIKKDNSVYYADRSSKIKLPHFKFLLHFLKPISNNHGLTSGLKEWVWISKIVDAEYFLFEEERKCRSENG